MTSLNTDVNALHMSLPSNPEKHSLLIDIPVAIVFIVFILPIAILLSIPLWVLRKLLK